MSSNLSLHHGIHPTATAAKTQFCTHQNLPGGLQELAQEKSSKTPTPVKPKRMLLSTLMDGASQVEEQDRMAYFLFCPEKCIMKADTRVTKITENQCL